MAEEEEKQEEKIDSTSDGITRGYISLAQARMLAMQTARETPGNYGRRFRVVTMAFEIVESGEDEDYYNVQMSFRPEGGFSGQPGREQFFIAKAGAVAHRQVLEFPKSGGRWRLSLIIAGVTVVIGAMAIGTSSLLGSGPLGALSPFTPTTLPTSTTIPDTQSTPGPVPVRNSPDTPLAAPLTGAPRITDAPEPTLTPPPATIPAPEVPTPAMVSTSFLGAYEYLVDRQGMTLYAFTLDTRETDSTATASFCTSEICVKAWPPLLTDGLPVAQDGANQSLIGTFQRNGDIQVTYNGWPLYRHIEDRVPGQTLGHGFARDFSILKPNGGTSFPFFSAGP